MKINVRWLFVGICLFGLTWLMSSKGTTSLVQAAPGDHWVRWQIVTAFPNDQIDTRLIIQFGHMDNNNDPIIDRQEDFPATCTTVGNLVIQNEEAIFDGSSYIICKIDSIQTRVSEMSKGAILLPDQCAAKRPFTMAELTIEKNPLNANSTNPVFQREDMEFAVPYDSGNETAEMVVSYGGVTAQSDPFVATGANQELKSLFQDNRVQIRPKFNIDGVLTPSNPSVLASQPIILSNLESTITIGYAVSGAGKGEYFEGKLIYLKNDPHCDGMG